MSVINVNYDVTLDSTLSVAGNTDLSGSLSVASACILGSTLSIGGAITLADGTTLDNTLSVGQVLMLWLLPLVLVARLLLLAL